MFNKPELQVVIKTLVQRRDWLAKNLGNPDLADSKAANQQTLALVESALAKLQVAESTLTPISASTRDATPPKENLARAQLLPEKIKVLIVDDDTLVTTLLTTYLANLGFKKIDIAENGLRAITMIYDAKPTYDLVLCDWNMPIKSGLDVHNAMRASERYQNTCFMLVTANTEAKQIRAAIEEGVDDYVVKPIDQSTLYKKISRIFPQVALAKPYES